MPEKWDRSRFLVEVKAALPEVTDDINAQTGLLHFEMEVVRLHAERMMGDGDHETLGRIFSLIDTAYSVGDKKLRDAVDVSFVEDLSFADTKKKQRRWAWEMFPEKLKQLYIAFWGRAP